MIKVMILSQAALTTMTNLLVWFGGLQVFHLMVLDNLNMVLAMLVLIMVLLLIKMLIFHQNQHKMI
jgi:hypothetical protein